MDAWEFESRVAMFQCAVPLAIILRALSSFIMI